MKDLKTLTVNIGMGSDSLQTIAEFFANEFRNNKFRLMGYEESTGQWNGRSERVFVAVFEHNYSRQSKVLEEWEMIAYTLQESCIAISMEGNNLLAWSPKVTPIGEFDMNLFISPSEVLKK